MDKAVERKDGYIMGAKGQNPRSSARAGIGFRSAFVNLPTA